jgi:ATP-dependent helicase HrpB
MQDKKIPLPIDLYLEDILNKIQVFSTILVKASPGSGKTTRLPWAIAEKSVNKVVVLEPRRLAAKLAAERIAYEENIK